MNASLRRAARPELYGEALERAMPRFWPRVEKTDGCWLWTGYRLPNGYGQIYVFGRHRVAHRVAWEHLNGPVPPGLELDHLCRNRRCVNPAHLEAVTGAENRRRGIGFPGENIRKTHCPKGHEYTPVNTRVRKDGRGRECRKCGADFAREARRRAAAKRALALDGHPSRGPYLSPPCRPVAK